MQSVLTAPLATPFTTQPALALRGQAQNGLQTGLSLSTPSHGDTLNLNNRLSLSQSAGPALHFGADSELRQMRSVKVDPKTGLRTGKLDGQMIRPGIDLAGINLSNANLSKVDLSTARIYNADLSGTDLSEAELHLANLSGADLRGANLEWARLEGANLRGAELTGAELTGAQNLPPSILQSVISDNYSAFYKPNNPPSLTEGLTYGQLANKGIVPANNLVEAILFYDALALKMKAKKQGGEDLSYTQAFNAVCQKRFPGTDIATIAAKEAAR